MLEKFQILNLGTGRGTSVFELVTLFERENNLQIPFKITSRRDGDAAESRSPSLALQVLAWSAKKEPGRNVPRFMALANYKSPTLAQIIKIKFRLHVVTLFALLVDKKHNRILLVYDHE